ncbi:hypothetical protein DL96DRAFT_1682896 [Flagelloscypha sp. PMI_526]|nr:hypothetical protein DL96DRAFT_1682896 [Flagelloscypha sp. PMI_526]
MPTGIQQDNELWFPSGNLIVECGGGDARTLFCVEVNSLAKHSGFFKDLIDLPLPTNQTGTNTNHQLIKLDDEPADLAQYLRILLEVAPFPEFSSSGFSDLASVLRLSHKYDDIYNKRRAASVFEDALVSVKESGKPGWLTSEQTCTLLPLFIEVQVDWLLQAPLFLISSDFEKAEPLVFRELEGRHDWLLRFSRGAKQHTQFIQGCYRGLGFICPHGSPCQGQVKSVSSDIVPNANRYGNSHIPSHEEIKGKADYSLYYLSTTHGYQGLEEPCRSNLKKILREGTDIWKKWEWKNIPRWYGLPSPSEVIDMKKSLYSDEEAGNR